MGLNDGAEKIVLDLTEVTNLTEGEKEAVCYLVGCRYEKEVFQSTYEQLCEEGQIDRDNPYYLSLIHIYPCALYGHLVHSNSSGFVNAKN